jgi:hypothetical protein
VREVDAALRGDVIPAPEIVDSVITLRTEQRDDGDSWRAQRMWRDEAEKFRARALSSQSDAGDRHASSTARTPKRLRKALGWAVGVVGTAIITMIVTGVVPTALSQYFNGPRIEDAIRQGPDIITSESMYYPDAGVPVPTVVPGRYSPPRELVQALSRPEAASSAAVQRRVRDARGVDVRDIFIRIILQGNRNEVIRVLSITPVNLRRTAPLDNVLFDMYGQGEDANIQIGFDLDQPFPQALNVAEPDVFTSQPFFEAHTISMSNGEQAVLVIQASTNCYSASFDLAVNYMVGGAARTKVISNAGQPFRVSAYRYTRGGLLSYRQVYELQGNFSVVRLDHQQLLNYKNPFMKNIAACPYISSSG